MKDVIDVQSNQLRTTALVDVFAIGWQLEDILISNMYWCCHIHLFVISCCFSLPWEMKSLLFCLSLSRTHTARSQLKEGWWLVKKLPSLFWFPFLNWSSWPFHGSSCSFNFSTPKWLVLVFHWLWEWLE